MIIILTFAPPNCLGVIFINTPYFCVVKMKNPGTQAEYIYGNTAVTVQLATRTLYLKYFPYLTTNILSHHTVSAC